MTCFVSISDRLHARPISQTREQATAQPIFDDLHGDLRRFADAAKLAV